MLNTAHEQFSAISEALEQDRIEVKQVLARGSAKERQVAIRKFVQQLEKYIGALETWQKELQANIQYTYKRNGFGVPKEDDPAWQLLKETNTRALLLSLRADKKEYEAKLQEAPQTRATVPLTDKLTLSLSEAAKLSGLSRAHLRQAIAEEELKAKIIGKGWRVKRADLNAYVERL